MKTTLVARSDELDSPQAESLLEQVTARIRWMRLLQIGLDATICAAALLGAYLIRFDGAVSPGYLSQFFAFLPWFVILRLAANWRYGVYRRLWRYTGLTEIAEIICSILTITTAIMLARAIGLLAVAGHQLSYSVIVIEGGLSFLMLSSPRVLRRLQTEHDQRRHWRQPVKLRALVVGAGDAGLMVLRELSQRADLGMEVVGFVDDDPQKLNKRIGHATVFGTTSELARIVDNLFVDQVIIAMPSAPPEHIRRIVDICRSAEVETRILPGLFELINGRVSISQLRQVSLEDLLGRDPVDLDTASIAGYIEGRRVLITGAGGSIGSELCRQIVSFQPSELILLGKGENSIFSICQELNRRSEPVKLTTVIADVRDYGRMVHIFRKHRPHVVFHAAAHKHVPLMEDNPCEAITNNVTGTQYIAELAAEFNVERFVLVSSDKAVNPSSVMGATKRVAELIIQELSFRSACKFVAVRFGNVLDSRGSVLPTWRQQIAAGGPLTITDKDMTRYFMLIPEAAQLIVQAGAAGSGGEIFVLDMGKPVRILDLAHDLLRLSGLSPGKDIDIKFTGLRPGEKLYEELLTAEEGLTKTIYKKILVGQRQSIDGPDFQRRLSALYAAAQADDEAAIRRLLSDMVGTNLIRSPISEEDMVK